MKSFEKLNIAKKITKNETTVIIYKVVKVGTKRVFFSPEVNGQKLTSTMFARLGSAETLSKQFLNKN